MSAGISMELSFVSDNSIKIKTKKTTIVVDPDTSVAADGALFTSPTQNVREGKIFSQIKKILIDGPGEYEIGGLMIKAKRVEEELLYHLDSQDGRFFLLPSSLIDKLKEEEESPTVVIHMESKVDERIFSQFPSHLCVVYGPESFLSFAQDSVVRLSRVNLRTHRLSSESAGESRGSVVFLTRT